MSWTYAQTPCRDLPDAGWASTPTACRDVADAGWATAPTSGRDLVLGGLLYVDGLGGIEIDALLGSGTTTSASGWTTTITGSCRDG